MKSGEQRLTHCSCHHQKLSELLSVPAGLCGLPGRFGSAQWTANLSQPDRSKIALQRFASLDNCYYQGMQKAR
jgi:hypothetical protein